MGRFLNQLLGGLNLRGVVGMSVLGLVLIELGVLGDVGLISSWWVVFGSSVELVWEAVLVNRFSSQLDDFRPDCGGAWS